MDSFVSTRAESYKSAIKCCGGEETSSANSKDSMLEAGEFSERLSFWQRPRQRVDLEFIDVTYSVKQNRKGEFGNNITLPRMLLNSTQEILNQLLQARTFENKGFET